MERGFFMMIMIFEGFHTKGTKEAKTQRKYMYFVPFVFLCSLCVKLFENHKNQRSICFNQLPS